MPIDLPDPAPASIDTIAPSLANTLLSCQLKAAFTLDKSFSSLRRPTPFTALGTAAHALAEQAHRGEVAATSDDDPTQAVERAWDEIVADQASRLAQAWAPARVPPPEKWPGYALTRSRAIRRAAKVAVGPRGQGSSTVETRLSDPDAGLYGTPDLIEHTPDGTRVVDLKSGVRQDAATDSQRRQLLLYAALVHHVEGEWPFEVAIEDARGRRHTEPLDPEAAQQAVVEVRAAVAAFNDIAAEGSIGHEVTASKEQCRGCSYRVACSPFWSALRSDWGESAALGVVESSGTTGDGAHAVLRLESPGDRRGDVVRVTHLAGSPPSRGDRFAIVDATRTHSTDEFRCRWDTLSRISP